MVLRLTSAKRLRGKLQALKLELKKRMHRLMNHWPPAPKICQPLPQPTPDRHHPRQEPYAVVPLVRICGGGCWVTDIPTPTGQTLGNANKRGRCRALIRADVTAPGGLSAVLAPDRDCPGGADRALALAKAVLAPDRDTPGGADRALALASCRVTAAKAAEATAMVGDAVDPGRRLHCPALAHWLSFLVVSS